MTAPADGVLAVDGGRQDPNEFTEWDRTADVRDALARQLAFALEAMWPSTAGRIDEDRRAGLQDLLDAFHAAELEHRAAVDRHYAARGAL